MEVYNEAAGKNRTRLEALSDGVFAVALTLIVLDIHVPSHANIVTEGDLLAAIGGLAPQFATWIISFLTIGIFWVGQKTQLNLLARTDRDLTWIHLVLLVLVTTLPFSTSLLSNYITFRSALVIYWLNILALGIVVLWSYYHAKHAKLFKDDVPAPLLDSIRRRVFIAQGLYAGSVALCFINTYVSIACIIVVQLNYAIAPRIGFLYKF